MIGAREAAESVVGAIKQANRDYEKFTHGWWLSDSGGEALMLTECVRKLAKDHGAPVVVEMPMSWLKDGVPRGMRRRGPAPRDLRKAGRCDIGLLRPGHETVHGIVELKRAQARSGWRIDLLRLLEAMKSFGVQDHPDRLRFAILGGYIASANSGNFKKKVTALEILVEEIDVMARKHEIRLEQFPQEVSIGPTRYDDGQLCCNQFAIALIPKGAHWGSRI